MKKQHGFLQIVKKLPGSAARDTRSVLRCTKLRADGQICGARRTLRKHVLLTGRHDRCAKCATAARRAPRRQATLNALPVGLRGAAVARLRAELRELCAQAPAELREAYLEGIPAGRTREFYLGALGGILTAVSAWISAGTMSPDSVLNSVAIEAALVQRFDEAPPTAAELNEVEAPRRDGAQ